MKKKNLFILTALFIALMAMINLHSGQQKDNINVSFVDISLMALADGESGSTPCETHCPNPGLGCIIKYDNGTMETCPDAHS